ncbi:MULTISPECIES: TIGR03751 family conjugal transfer lipoprotein [Rodentibacter]|uniref:TIGR03751 family conjugal transfer lipoprotein n=2 Tax=Rodentibacter TaxID=1960084 RepID=A0A4S2Q3A3_9PAST|nr:MULTISPECIES: TIGR03751 family conjugal transfer lipoprotein [Rodentibacter]OOF72447.1 conjugal transfer protein [Rodentibacter heylii]OOF76875.1 conjugal transfer protein [Rodentibacter heylii]THA11008.1 TIGR03751 family conjugal transfer lipoprotein [Rodentibacter pneumotropicus]
MKMRYLLPFLTALLMTGCSTSQEKLLPAGDRSMAEIWKNGGGSSQSGINEARDTLDSSRPLEGRDVVGDENIRYTRTAENEVTNLFPRLPNPDMTLYVFPHLTNSAEQLPVPGYTTVFPFYGRIQYAQPGERTRDY